MGTIQTERLALVIAPELKKRFKIACAIHGVEMSDIVRDFIEEWLKEKETGKK